MAKVKDKSRKENKNCDRCELGKVCNFPNDEMSPVGTRSHNTKKSGVPRVAS